MNSPATDIVSLLNTAGVATSATDLFISMLPDEPDNCIAVYDMGGTPEEGLCAGEMDSWQVLVRTRNSRYNDAYEAATAVEAALNQLASTEIGSTVYCGIHRQNVIRGIGRDRLDRFEFEQVFYGIRYSL